MLTDWTASLSFLFLCFAVKMGYLSELIGTKTHLNKGMTKITRQTFIFALFFLSEMNTLQAEVMKKKDRKRKSKTAVVGDLTDLQETLPTLELLMKKSSGKTQDK